MEYYRPDIWGNGGPKLLTRILSIICRTIYPSKMTREKCRGFKVFAPSEFYVVPWSSWDKFFKPEFTNEVLQLTNNASFIHVWNGLSSRTAIKKSDPDTAYGVIAKEYCPRAYQASGEYF